MNWKHVENFDIFYLIPVYDWNALEKIHVFYHIPLGTGIA
jgi:hypothetical protein